MLKIDAWKHYTHNPLNTNPWRYDDEKLAYPFWEKSLQLGMNITCVHKVLADSSPHESFAHPRDIKKAALDFPKMNFVVYHSGMRHGYRGFNAGTGPEYIKAQADKLGGVEWTRELCRDRDENPKMTNVYCEIGSVFAMCVGDPVMMGHLLGSLIKFFGSDHVLWGTDCLWWGSPQWIIQAMHRFQMPEEVQKQWGYPPVTREDKEKIFGLNAAKLYNVNLKAQRKAIPGDYMSRYQAAWQAFGQFRVRRTAAGTGILLYISLFERRVCVLGDEAIAVKLDQKTWDEIRDTIIGGLRSDHAAEAVCQAIARCGELLGQYFPYRTGDVNEITDELRLVN